MTFPIELFILFGVSVLCSSVGLYRYIYFISIGYGLSIAGCGAILLLLHHGDASRLLCGIYVLLIVYGLRLATYLAIREKGKPAYRRHMENEVSEGPQDMGMKLILWFGCAALYALMVSPVCYRIVDTGAAEDADAGRAAAEAGAGAVDGSVLAAADILLWIGAGLMVVGILLEWGADISKNLQKKKYPGEVCRRGLYRFVRCPNYFGELLLWTGVLVCGVPSLHTVGQWIIAGLGYLGIVFLMFSGARRLEIRQNRNYGDDPRYQRYVKKVPIIIPLLPLYSVEKWRFLVF